MDTPERGEDGYYDDWPAEAKGYGERWKHLTWTQFRALTPSADKAGFGYGLFKRMLKTRQPVPLSQEQRDEAKRRYQAARASEVSEA